MSSISSIADKPHSSTAATGKSVPRVTFIFADGERKVCKAPADRSILAAARAAGLPLASDCEIGDCQTCKAHLRSGKVEVDELAFVTLDDDEIERGAVLTCVSMAQGDVEIELPYVRGHLIAEKTYAMKVCGVERMSPTTVLLRGELPRNSPLVFHPGQYVTIKIPGTDVLRSYSMASDPASPGVLEFHIRLLTDGRMSDFIRTRVAVGSHLDIVGPKGVFYLRDDDNPIVMIAGGTGLAPMVSMLRSIAGSDRPRRPVALCFGVSGPDDLYYVDELEALRKSLPNLQVRMAMAAPDQAWTGRRGFVTSLVTSDDLREWTQVYLCGPPAMIAAARKLLGEHGVPDGSIFAEEFLPSGAR
jgi:NAD(P)H-flavin reductase/ferredoxin